MVSRRPRSKQGSEPIIIPEGAGTWKLMEHQEYARFMMDCNPTLLISYGLGCGKTSIALDWIRSALKSGTIDDALVVCPASLQTNWRKSIDKMLMFEGYTVEDIRLMREKITIVSYQKTYTIERKEVHHRNGVVSRKKEISINPDIDKLWGCIVYDESHGLGSHSSIQTKVALKLRDHAYYRYLLSATPIHGAGGKQDFAKLYGQMEFLHPGVFGTWTEFCNDYVLSMDRWYKPERYDVKRCTKVLTDHSIVCRIEDIADMPERTYIDIDCDLAESTIYKNLKSGRIDLYNLEPMQGGAMCQKLLQVCSGSMKRAPEEGGPMRLRTSKDEALKDILLGTDDKVVVFCNYKASIDRVMEISKKCGRSAVRYDSSAAEGDWEEFQNGSKDLICAQYRKGSAGLDLFASHTCVFYEPCFSSLDFEQAHGRIYRTGQTNHCLYYYLRTPRTIEAKALQTVRDGKDITNRTMEDWALGNFDFEDII